MQNILVVDLSTFFLTVIQLTEQYISDLLEDMTSYNDIEAIVKAKNLYASCMDLRKLNSLLVWTQNLTCKIYFFYERIVFNCKYLH